jgi:CRP/FNR family transcriptional regulator
MNENPLYQLFETSGPTRYGAGEIIARADDEASVLFCIKSGYVRVYSINSRNEEYMHIIYKRGELFPVLWLTEKAQRGVFYEALEPTQVYKIPVNQLIEQAKTNPKLSFALTEQVIRQYNIYLDRVDNLEYKFGRERLAYRLLFMASRFGRKTSRGLLIDIPMTQKVLGSSINLSRETVARELRRLEDHGLVTYEDRRILIIDLDKLSNELKDPINPDLWGLKPKKPLAEA